jgi:TolB protein
MKIKNLITAGLVAFMLVSCAPGIRVVPPEAATSSSESRSSASESGTSKWSTYTSDSFLVTLKYPADWDIHNEGYDVYSGRDGFFQLSASSIAAPTAKEWCELEVQHNPDKTGFYRYGTKPTMEVLKVDQQPACLVLPSDDQPESQRGYSLLVVEYPALEQGRTRLLFFMADKKHMRDFIDTLKFVR